MSQPAKMWVIVPAAGVGSRMGVSTPKQYLQLDQQRVLEITLTRFLNHKEIDGIVVCVAENDELWPTLEVAKQAKIETTFGGATRAQSVFNGLQYLTDLAADKDWVLVHDAARPCLSVKSLNKLIDSLRDQPVGGILAVPARDTLKQATDDGRNIEQTLDRSKVWQAQTPQMFRFGLLKSALQSATEQEQVITDEASAMELAGHQVKLVEGDASNIKITNKEDLRLAKLLLSD